MSYENLVEGEEVNQVIQVTLAIRNSLQRFPDANNFQELLDELGPIVLRTAREEEYRQRLAHSKELWEDLRSSLQDITYSVGGLVSGNENAFWYVRTVRGLILLMRNLSASNQVVPRELKLQKVSIEAFLQVSSAYHLQEEIVISLYILTVSFLHNISKDVVEFDVSELEPLIRFLQYPIEIDFEENQELLHCHASFLLNLAGNTDFLYSFFKSASCARIMFDYLLEDVVENHTDIYRLSNSLEDESYELKSLDAVILKIFSRFAANESFIEYLLTAEEESSEKLTQLLKILQLVVTGSERWDKFELTNIMSWCFPIFKRSAEATSLYFQTGIDDERKARWLHEKLSITLDIISKLGQYEHVQKYMLHYGGLEALVSLLAVLQNNLIRINFYKNPNGSIKGLKTTDSVGEKILNDALLHKRVDYNSYRIKPTNFPECKLLIIEILAILVYGRREVQDKIRELHGLELILSNCVIDDNDPFIKERSVMCIKFLLKDNKPNQDFVAQLEAKKAVSDETLSEAGYEVKIGDSGELKLNPAPSLNYDTEGKTD